MTARPLKDIAADIQRHLARFAADKAISHRTWTDGWGQERTLALYWKPVSCRSGSRVMVKYIAYHNWSSLTKAEALKYLAWLDAGNVGAHYKAIEGNPGDAT